MFTGKGRGAPEMEVATSVRVVATKAQDEGTDAIFHDCCHACLWKKGNSQGEGLRWCVGCTISDWSMHKPNRRLSRADPSEIEYEDGYA